jgi:hypothetical protein
VFVAGFGESTFNFEVRAFVDSFDSFEVVRDMRAVPFTRNAVLQLA